MDYRLNKLLTSAHNAYEASQLRRINVPVDMAQFALREKASSQVRTYLCAQFLFSGKARTTDRPARLIAEQLDITERTVYRHFEWLLERNWISKTTDWWWFKGIDFIRNIERWKHRLSAKMLETDLRTVKEFFTGAVLNGICKTRKKKTGRLRGRSLKSFIPISLATLEKVLDVSKKTAFTYRKKSAGKYYKMMHNLRQVHCIQPASEVQSLKNVSRIQPVDIHRLKSSHIDSVTLKLFGSTDTITAKPEQLRTRFGYVYVQLANLIQPTMMICKRTR